MFTARTPKEKWAIAIWNLKNEIRKEKGVEPITDEAEVAYFVRTNSGRNKQLHELEYEYKCRKGELVEIRKQKAAEAYWKTDEGAKRQEELKRARKAIQDEYKVVKSDCEKRANELAVTVIGEGWGALQLNESYMKLAMLDPDKPGETIFGQTIDVYYEEKHWDGFDRETGKSLYKERFEFNIGSCGSFDVITDDVTSRAAFYIGVGRLLANKEALESLRDILKTLSNHVSEKWDKVDAINKQLKNPLGTENE